jgi:hypothetical protein
MESLFYVLCAIATMALLPSCGCDYADTNIDNCVPKIKRITYYDANEPYSVGFAYNDDGLLSKKGVISYSYQGDTMVMLSSGAYYTLNDDGMAEYSNGSPDPVVVGRQYDSDGRAVSELENGQNISYTYDGDNLSERHSNSMSFSSVVQYTYYMDKENTIGNQNMGQPYLGKQSENPIKSESSDWVTVDYSYDFYSNGNIKAKYIHNNLLAEYEYY